MSSLLSFGILHPWALALAAPILGALMYAYLRKQKLVTMVIPSLFLLRDLAQPVSTRRNFVPPLRFWLELLVLLLLLLCLMGIFRKTKTERYGVLIDNSLSTAARIGEESVIELLRAQAKDALRELPGDAVFDLYRTSPRLERVGRGDLSKGELFQAVSELEPDYGSDSFNDQLPQVVQRGQYNRFVVLSDRQLEFDSAAVEMRKAISLHTVHLSDPARYQNIALTAISFERDPQKEGQGSIRVTASAFTKQAVSLSLIVERLDYADRAQVWKELNRQALSLAPREARPVVFPIDSRKLEGVRVRIDAEALPAGVDTLQEDNQLYFSFKRENRLVYVVSARNLQDLGIEKIRGIRFKALTVEQFQREILQEEAATFLLVDFLPDGLPDKNLIIVSPPKGTGGFGVGKVVSGAELTEWKSGHPLLTYIDTASIRLSRFVPLTPPLWGESVISTSRGSALIAGERGARRTVVAGFDLFPYRGRVSPTISVLFLNMLRWVSADPLGERLLAPYEPIRLVREVKQVLAVSDSVEEKVLPADEEGTLFVPSKPGMYLGFDAEVMLSASAVNFISPHESDLLTRQELLGIISVPPAPDKLEKQQSLSDYLIPILLGVILLDMFYLLFRMTNRRRLNSPLPGGGRVAA